MIAYVLSFRQRLQYLLSESLNVYVPTRSSEPLRCFAIRRQEKVVHMCNGGTEGICQTSGEAAFSGAAAPINGKRHAGLLLHLLVNPIHGQKPMGKAAFYYAIGWMISCSISLRVTDGRHSGRFPVTEKRFPFLRINT